MVDDGYEEVINIDISIVVIRHMETKYADRPHLKCIFFIISLLRFILLFLNLNLNLCFFFLFKKKLFRECET